MSFFYRFPRQGGVLKVSAHTRQRVEMWILMLEEWLNNHSNLDHYKEINRRMSFYQARTMTEICSGLSKAEAQSLRSMIGKFVKKGLIEKLGENRPHLYRLTVHELVRMRDRSVLRDMKNRGIARRFS